MRGLLPEHPELEVYTEAPELLAGPEGAAAILAVRLEDALFLNAQRPRFAEGGLKVILWCSAETSAGLAREAPDFFDWISHRVECPPITVPSHKSPFALEFTALRRTYVATGMRAPGRVAALWVDESQSSQPEAMFEAGMRLARSGFYEEARAVLGNASTAYLISGDIRLYVATLKQLATIASSEGHYDEARALEAEAAEFEGG